MTEGATISVCPICGGPLFDQDLQWVPGARALIGGGAAVIFSKQQARFFETLWNARRRGTGVPREMIFHALYYDDPNGGADCTSIVSTMACYMRRKLRRFGLTIVSSSSMYRLTGR